MTLAIVAVIACHEDVQKGNIGKQQNNCRKLLLLRVPAKQMSAGGCRNTHWGMLNGFSQHAAQL